MNNKNLKKSLERNGAQVVFTAYFDLETPVKMSEGLWWESETLKTVSWMKNPTRGARAFIISHYRPTSRYGHQC